MLRYQNNAFRILGLKPDVSIKQIVHRVNEIKVKKSLGIEVVYDYDFMWMGPLDRTESSVTNALQRLENPVARLREEIFWFWFDTNRDKQAIDYLTQNDRQAAHNTWKTLVVSDTLDKKSVSAFINQTILAHSSVIGEEITVKYKEETENYRRPRKRGQRNVDLDETHWKNWRFVINKFASISSENIFWAMIREKAEKINDPRLSTAKVDEIRDNFLQNVAETNFRFISRVLVSKDYERIREHSALLNGSSLPVDVLRKGFSRVLMPQTDLLNRHSQKASRELLEIKKEGKNSDKTMDKTAVWNLYSKLVDNTANIIYEGNSVDINSISDFALAKDTFAEVIRDSAIILNNILTADYFLPQRDREIGCSHAYEMIKKALESAGSVYIKQKFEKDKELIKNNLETVRAYNGYHQRTFRTPSPSKFNWKPLLIWGGIILFFIIIGNLSDESSNPKSSPPDNLSNQKSSPPIDTNPNYESFSPKSSLYINQGKGSSSLDESRSKIDTLKKELEEKSLKLSKLDAELNSNGKRLSSLKNEIEKMNREYKNQQYIPNNIISDYNRKIDEYNRLAPIYNNILNERKKLYNEVSKKIKIHDSLAESYNRKIR